MTVDLNVLDHLADGLYSSLAAVLTEAVANAWDADASKVAVDLGDDTLTITDNGVGMTQTDVNDRYLRVGYRRRNDGDASPGGRAVMGRKGIGKLSLVSIADTITVVTKKKGSAAVGLQIEVPELRAAMKRSEPQYEPRALTEEEVDFDGDSGTRITASALKKGRLREASPVSLRRRLARRFSVIGSEDFDVAVNGESVGPSDREDLKFVEYLWVFDGSEVDTSSCRHLARAEPMTLTARGDAWPPTGS